MRRVVTSLALLLLLAAPFGVAGVARADDSALSRLTAQELDHLKRNVTAWDDLPEERRERIAKNVLRLRDLTPEERQRLLTRVDRFRKEDATLRERFPERLAKIEAKPRGRFQAQAALAGALGEALVRALPEDVRASLRRAGPAAGEGIPMRPPMLGFAFTKAVLGRAAEESVQSGDVLRSEPSEEARAKYDAWKARVAAAGAETRDRETRALAWFVAEDRLRTALAAKLPPLPPPTPGARKPTLDGDALVEAFRGAFPKAYQATWDEFVDRARRGPDDVDRFLQHYGQRPGEEAKREGLGRGAFFLVRFLEAAGPWLATDAEARAQTDRLVEAVLVRGLRVPPEALERLPGWDRPGERLRALKRLLLLRAAPR